MDPAGSLAIDQQRVKRLQVYYNTTVKPMTPTAKTDDSNRGNKEKVSSSIPFTKSSCISPSLLRQKKILSGRIVKKYRLRNVVHSTQQLQQLWPNECGFDICPTERLSLRDQIVTNIRHSYWSFLSKLLSYFENNKSWYLIFRLRGPVYNID